MALGSSRSSDFFRVVVARTLTVIAIMAPLFRPEARVGRLSRPQANLCPEVTTGPSTLTVISPALEYTVAHFNASWFDTRDPEKAPTLFTLIVDPSLKALGSKLRLRVMVEADTSLGRASADAHRLTAFDRFSDTLGSERIGIPLRSNDVFGLPYLTGGIGFEESELYDFVANNRTVPEMNLRFKFALTCEEANTVGSAFTTLKVTQFGPTGRLRQVRTVRALSPGNDIASIKPASIYTLTPSFLLASELFNNQEFSYPASDPKFQYFIYRVEPGQNPKDALEGIEYAQFPGTQENPIVYPPGQPLLEPGRTYVWRARANLRGPSTEYLWSNALVFTVDRILGGGTPEAPQAVGDLRTFATQVKYGDDYTKRVLAALKQILGENYEVFDLSRGEKIPSRGLLRLNGQPITLEELERLAKEFHDSKHLLTRMRMQ